MDTLDEQLRAADPAARMRPAETVPLIAAMTTQLPREAASRRPATDLANPKNARRSPRRPYRFGLRQTDPSG